MSTLPPSRPLSPGLPSLPSLALSAFVALALGFVAPATAIDAGDMNPHLPDEVVLAAMRFHNFTRKAEDKHVWEQKHAEFLRMLESELEESSLSDNRAATALRALITDLKDAKFVEPKKHARLPNGKLPSLPNGKRVLLKKEFHIAEPDERSIVYPFKVEEVPAMLQIGIGGGSDDSGDNGLHYLLIDPVGRVIKRGFSAADEFVWEEHQGMRCGTWKLIIEDLDTDLDDKHDPGNRGVVEVLCKVD